MAVRICGIYATWLLKRKDAELRHAWIGKYRVLRRHLEHQLAADNMILALRSMVLDGSDTIRIEAGARSAPLAVEVDGRTLQDMPTPATVDVRTAAGKARLVRTRPRTFCGDLARR